MYNGNNWFKEVAAPPWHLVLTMLASAVVQNLKKLHKERLYVSFVRINWNLTRHLT